MKNILSILLVVLMLSTSGCGIIQKTSDLTIEDLKGSEIVETVEDTKDVVEESENIVDETVATESSVENTEDVVDETEEATENTTEEVTETVDGELDNQLSAPSAVTYTRVNETVYATTTVNVRSGPGSNYELLSTMYVGDSIVRTAIGDNGWSKVTYNGKEAYLYSNYVSTKKPVVEETKQEEPKKEETVVSGPVYTKVNETVYSTADVNVRKGPGTNYDVVKTLSKGDSVTRIGVGDNGWSKISLNGKEYFIKSNYLSTTKPKVETPVETTPPKEESKPEVTFKAANDYLYSAVKMLDVRKGPGEDYVIIGGVCKNGYVHRIGVSDTGWSKIEFCDGIGYVLTSELSYSKIEEPRDPNKTVSEEMAERSGMIGRLYINDVGLDVALFGCPVYQSSQSIVDKKDSAAYLYAVDYYGYDLIADHNIDGFEKMKSSVVGKTVAVIDYGTYTQKYICTANFVGRNTGSALVDGNGNDISGTNNGGITMYTCNVISGSVTITFWQPI